jgi:hypothetical protein
LKNLLVPSLNQIPKWVGQADFSVFDNITKPKTTKKNKLPELDNLVCLEDIFTIKNGIAATGLKEKEEAFDGCIMYVHLNLEQVSFSKSY